MKQQSRACWIPFVALAASTKEAQAWVPLFRRDASWAPASTWKPVPQHVLYPPDTPNLAWNDEDYDSFPQTLGDLDLSLQQLNAVSKLAASNALDANNNNNNDAMETKTTTTTTTLDNGDYYNNDPHISYTDAGTLQLHFAATGITSNAVMAGAFATAWFGALVPATTLTVAPMLLPFYLAGGLMAKQAVVDPFTSTTLSLGDYAWSLDTSRYQGPSKSIASGATSDIVQAVVVERSSVDKETKTRRFSFDLQLVLNNTRRQTTKPVTVRRGFANRDEPERLAHTVNQHLAQIRALENDKEPGRDRFTF